MSGELAQKFIISDLALSGIISVGHLLVCTDDEQGDPFGIQIYAVADLAALIPARRAVQLVDPHGALQKRRDVRHHTVLHLSVCCNSEL